MSGNFKRHLLTLLLAVTLILTNINISGLIVSAKIADNAGTKLFSDNNIDITINKTELRLDKNNIIESESAKNYSYDGYNIDLSMHNTYKKDGMNAPVLVSVFVTGINGHALSAQETLQYINGSPDHYYSRTYSTRINAGATITRTAVLSYKTLKNLGINKVNTLTGYIKISDIDLNEITNETTGAFEVALSNGGNLDTTAENAPLTLTYDSSDFEGLNGKLSFNLTSISSYDSSSNYTFHCDYINTTNDNYLIIVADENDTALFNFRLESNQNQLKSDQYYLPLTPDSLQKDDEPSGVSDTSSSTTPSTTPGTTPIPMPESTGQTITDPYTGATYVITTDGGVRFESTNNSKVSKVVIPAYVTINGKSYPVTSISANAFKGNTSLRSITVGKNVKVIEANAFSGAKNLTSLDLKSSKIETIGKNAFKGCKKLSSLKVNGNTLKSVAKGAFNSAGKKVKVTIYAKDKKTFNADVKKLTKGGLKSANYKFKKKK